MKPKVLLLFFLSLSISVSAQNTFFPLKEGVRQKYVQKNGKGKVENYSCQTVKSVEGSGKDMTIFYTLELLDKEQNPLDPSQEIPCKMVIKNDVMILDMNEMLSAMKGMQTNEAMRIEITGMPMELPNTLQPGQMLKDANVVITTDMGMMKLSTTINLTDGKCLAIEDIAVPAGTFKCHKITQTSTISVMNKNVITKAVSWYALGVGLVKTEIYDEKDKLQNSTELVELKR